MKGFTRVKNRSICGQLERASVLNKNLCFVIVFVISFSMLLNFGQCCLVLLFYVGQCWKLFGSVVSYWACCFMLDDVFIVVVVVNERLY